MRLAPRASRLPVLLGAAVLLAAAPASLAAQNGPAPDAGPLFIVGGGRQPDALLTRFVDRAGGPGRARIAVIPLASSDARPSGAINLGTGSE